MVLRWWLAGLRFGDVTVTTSLRKRQIYGVYVRFLAVARVRVVPGGRWSLVAVLVRPGAARTAACAGEILATVGAIGPMWSTMLGVFDASIRRSCGSGGGGYGA